VYNPTWDTRRLWVTELVEQARTINVEGVARDAEDVSELARRVNLSSYFYDVRLLPGRKAKASDAKLDVVSFKLQARVRY
jgi:type IV pilus assembly protein PilN